MVPEPILELPDGPRKVTRSVYIKSIVAFLETALLLSRMMTKSRCFWRWNHAPSSPSWKQWDLLSPRDEQSLAFRESGSNVPISRGTPIPPHRLCICSEAGLSLGRRDHLRKNFPGESRRSPPALTSPTSCSAVKIIHQKLSK